jgi:hypothetical protein
MKKSEILSLVGLVGGLAVAGFAGKIGGDYINQRASERESDFPRTALVEYYTADGQDYALLENSRWFGHEGMPGSFIKSERYSVPSNSVPNLVQGERVR